jgi:S-adenosylmethionine decarboxylase proenzyme
MNILGRHLIAELSDCNTEILNNLPKLQSILNEAARLSGAVVVDSVFHRYNPQGLSGIVVIAESHLSIHTWPEYDYAAIDCFTCGTSVDPYKAVEYLKTALSCRSIKVREINRGIPSDSDKIIAHKTNTDMIPAAIGD